MSGVCLVASSDPGTTDGSGVEEAVCLQAVVSPEAADSAATRSVLGARHKNYSSKGIPTLTAMVMGKHVSR